MGYKKMSNSKENETLCEQYKNTNFEIWSNYNISNPPHSDIVSPDNEFVDIGIGLRDAIQKMCLLNNKRVADEQIMHFECRSPKGIPSFFLNSEGKICY